MGALKDYIARNPNTERPSVINFPVRRENPYQIDVTACEQLIAEHKPELIILGKSVILHPEPIREIKNLVEKYSAGSLIMYDMAHVLGLVGPHFQQPFQEGADVVSGSTHKTFFGPQRGIVAGNFDEEKPEFELWETVERRAFPGSVSNHHLGTLVGLLISAYEMNHFKDEYQKNVIGNAKVLAKALHENGLSVAGDPDVSFTQTHQVVINVGYCRGPELASRLEDNNIIVNYQACPDEEGFTAAGALRLGVAEMTRFGMGPEDFKQLASYIKEVIVDNKDMKEEIKKFRLRFSSMKYCFSDDQLVPYIQKIHKLV
jgi:aminomethyltransferase